MCPLACRSCCVPGDASGKRFCTSHDDVQPTGSFRGCPVSNQLGSAAKRPRFDPQRRNLAIPNIHSRSRPGGLQFAEKLIPP